MDCNCMRTLLLESLRLSPSLPEDGDGMGDTCVRYHSRDNTNEPTSRKDPQTHNRAKDSTTAENWMQFCN